MPLAPDVLRRVQGDIRPLRAHFNHAGMSLTPAPAFARVQEHLELEAQIGGYEAAETIEPELAAVSDSIARLLNASAAECAGTESATASWEWALWAMAESFHWSDRDRVLVDQFAYNTMHASLRRLAEAHGVEVIEVGALPDGRIDPGALAAALDDRVRLVLVTHMPTHVGTVTDAAEIGTLVRPSGAIYALDVAQTVGQMAVDVEAIGCDVAFAPAWKFLRAPCGTGLLYVRRVLADQLVPLTPAFGTEIDERTGRFVLASGLRRFEQYENAIRDASRARCRRALRDPDRARRDRRSRRRAQPRGRRAPRRHRRRESRSEPQQPWHRVVRALLARPRRDPLAPLG